MKYINTFATKAFLIGIVFSLVFSVSASSVFADATDYSADYYTPYDSYSSDYYTPYDNSYSADYYTPYDTSYSADYYTPYESPTYSADYYTPYESPSYAYETPSYAYETSYAAPSYSASYSAPVYGSSYVSGASYVAPVYQAPVYTQPVYTQPVYTNPAPTYTALQATCYAQTSNPYVGQNVTWVANASGGNGSYTYTWGGTNISDQHSQSVTTSYNSIGGYTASVTVMSNGQSVNVNCGSINVRQYQAPSNGFTLSCYPNVNSAPVGTSITWTAVVNGGNGNYTYNWTDNNGNGNNVNSTGSSYTTTYITAGSKSPTLTVSAYGNNYGYNNNGFSQTVNCQPVSIYSAYNAGYSYTYPTNGSLASLSSVSLSQVPYTGLADSAGFWEFLVGLVLASLAGTWYFAKVYARGKRRFAINMFKKQNLASQVV